MTITPRKSNVYIYVIDSCEYIGYITGKYSNWQYLTHKGNCKFCHDRRKKKLIKKST